MIGKKRANYILELRKDYLSEVGFDVANEGYFKTIEELTDIGMKLKDCETFLKKNVGLLAGLEQK